MKISTKSKWVVNTDCFTKFSLHKKWSFPLRISSGKYDQIRSFLQIWSHLLKKSLMENLFFCAMFVNRWNILSAKSFPEMFPFNLLAPSPIATKKWLSLNLLTTLWNASKASKVLSYHYELLQVDFKKWPYFFLMYNY